MWGATWAAAGIAAITTAALVLRGLWIKARALARTLAAAGDTLAATPSAAAWEAPAGLGTGDPPALHRARVGRLRAERAARRLARRRARLELAQTWGDLEGWLATRRRAKAGAPGEERHP
ncbi:MAG: hypothetical protein FWG11_05590 [Promicromonosporaceae bacterium]|nr:hypothetical protein [Promicromonosporaceae bacterium]